MNYSLNKSCLRTPKDSGFERQQKSSKSKLPLYVSKTPSHGNLNFRDCKTPKAFGDRFVPNRTKSQPDLGYYLNMKKQIAADHLNYFKEQTETSGKIENTTNMLNQMYLGCSNNNSRILNFSSNILDKSSKNTNPLKFLDSFNISGMSQSFNKSTSQLAKRLFPLAPDKILDAPELMNDHCLNLLDWSTKNILAIALGSSVYLWNGTTGETTHLVDVNEQQAEGDFLENTNYVSSVGWTDNGRVLAIGLNSSKIQIWDVNKTTMVRCISGDFVDKPDYNSNLNGPNNTNGNSTYRITSLSWNEDGLLSVGSRSGRVLHHDVKRRDHVVAFSNYHKAEVCGLKWDPCGRQLASSSTDGTLLIWDKHCIFSSSSKNNSSNSADLRNSKSPNGHKSKKSPDLKSSGQPTFNLTQNEDYKALYRPSHTNYKNIHNSTLPNLNTDIANLRVPNLNSTSVLPLTASKLVNGHNSPTCQQQANFHKGGIDVDLPSIKALAWCPWSSNLLATASGRTNPHLQFWHTKTGRLIKYLPVVPSGQVYSLAWSIRHRELVSSHGAIGGTRSADIAPSTSNGRSNKSKGGCAVEVWNYPGLDKVASLNKHKNRVLFTAFSPCGSYLASVGADETIMIWKYTSDLVTDKTSTSFSFKNNLHSSVSTNGGMENIFSDPKPDLDNPMSLNLGGKPFIGLR